jgi:hypothetical protein
LRSPILVGHHPGRTPLPPKITTTPPEEEAPLKMPRSSKGNCPMDRVPSPGLDISGSRSAPEGPATSEGNTTRNIEDHRDGDDFSSPPEQDEESGAGNMGAGNDQPGSSEPAVVPLIPDNSSPMPATSEPADSTVIPPTPPKTLPAKTPTNSFLPR